MAGIRNIDDYYPGGMPMPGRSYSSNAYRFGFNGKENDNEVKGTGNNQDYGMRIYDPRIIRFNSVDPLTSEYPWYTPYQFAGNKFIWAIDRDGLEEWYTNSGSTTPDDGSGPVKPGAGPMTLDNAYENGYRSYSVGTTVDPGQGQFGWRGENFLKNEELWRPNLYDNDGAKKTLDYHYLGKDGKTQILGTVKSGNTTIGWGHLVHKGPIIPSNAIDKELAGKMAAEAPFKNGISKVQGQNLFNSDVGTVKNYLNKRLNTTVFQNQFEALVSFGFNAGNSNLAPVIELLNSGDLEGASNYIETYRWNSERHNREVDMFNQQNIFHFEPNTNGGFTIH